MSGVDLVEQGINIKELRIIAENKSENNIPSELLVKNLALWNNIPAYILNNDIRGSSEVKDFCNRIATHVDLVAEIIPEVNSDPTLSGTDFETYVSVLANLKLLDPEKFSKLNKPSNEMKTKILKSFEKNINPKSWVMLDLDKLFKFKILFPEFDLSKIVESYLHNINIKEIQKNLQSISEYSDIGLDHTFAKLAQIKLLAPDIFARLNINVKNSKDIYNIESITIENLLTTQNIGPHSLAAIAYIKVLKADTAFIDKNGEIILRNNNLPNVNANQAPLERSFT